MELGKLDQPDNYTGNHHLVTITHISIDTLTRAYHLILPNTGSELPPSYCGQLNPRLIYPTAKLGFRLPQPSVGMIAREAKYIQAGDDRYTPCPNCLNMALCQAEMLGQRYKVKTLIRTMAKLPDKQTPSQK